MDNPGQSPNNSSARRTLLTGLFLASVALAMFIGSILGGWVTVK
ncbi:MAG: hypothetical protein NT159_23460 [Proteobacteria bacterium]|nr:hypothetical protein [Pseudomonadota bacterium]